MRLLLIIPLLAVVVYGRPQSSEPSESDWKPVEEPKPQTQTIRENQETRTYKTESNTALKDSVQQVTQQLKPNRTEIFTDTRTPPKIRFQQKNIEKKKAEIVENSHPGVAVPIDVETFLETTTQKRPVIYRNENKTPLPDGGISTWILLSGQSTTSKPVRKSPAIKVTTTIEPQDNKTTLTTEKTVKTTIKIKPLTTRKLKTTTPIPSTTTAKVTTEETLKTTEKKLMTKIKASVLTNAVKNKTVTTPTPNSQNTTPLTTEQPSKVNETNKTTTENVETNELHPEAKIGGMELSEKSAQTTKRPRRPTTTTNKRKKNNNKTRRRKPTNETVTASEKIDTAVGNSTKLKEKPIGTQIYNYLSREIMPTVGVGLVGLMVTAGLASYFLYPFGGLRRTFEGATDRKDYYYDEYATGGMAEEELIGKVIAGMPEHTEYSPNSYRTNLARKDAYKNDVNYNYRTADPYYSNYNNNNNKEFHTVSVGSKIGYGRDVIEHQKESAYSVDDGELEKNQFVVGNIPKEFEPVTSDSVPEHGPRNLRVRRRAQNDADNEIDFKYESTKDKYPATVIQTFYVEKSTAKSDITTSTEKPTESTVLLQPDKPSFLSFLRNLLELKVRLGLDFLLRTTDTFSNYLKNVQSRVNHVLKEENSRTPPR